MAEQRFISGGRPDDGIARNESDGRRLSEHDAARLRVIAAGDASAEWLDVHDVVLYLNISRWTVYRLVKKGVIPHIRLGRAIRINRQALDLAVAKTGLAG